MVTLTGSGVPASFGELLRKSGVELTVRDEKFPGFHVVVNAELLPSGRPVVKENFSTPWNEETSAWKIFLDRCLGAGF